MLAQLEFNGWAVLDINNDPDVIRDLVSSPITKFQASHSGLATFSLEFNAKVSLIGSV